MGEPVVERLLGGVADVDRRIEVGLADLEVDDVLPCASSALALASTSKAVSVPIVRMREATRRVDAVGIIEPPTAMEAEHHLRRSAASRPSRAAVAGRMLTERPDEDEPGRMT